MVNAVQAKRADALIELFQTFAEYKTSWERVFEEYDQRGEPRPDPLPHPDDIKLDFNEDRVKFNGPSSPDDKAHWDQMFKRREDAFEEIAALRKEIKRRKTDTTIYEEDIAREQYLIDMVSGILPDEKTRRQPGFDIDEWRARKGVLAALN